MHALPESEQLIRYARSLEVERRAREDAARPDHGPAFLPERAQVTRARGGAPKRLLERARARSGGLRGRVEPALDGGCRAASSTASLPSSTFPAQENAHAPGRSG